MVWHYPETDDEPGAVEVFVDSDWAGSLSTRKSTSGGVLSVAVTAMKAWSSTQGSVATSVAEAEFFVQHSRELQKHSDLRRWQGT